MLSGAYPCHSTNDFPESGIIIVKGNIKVAKAKKSIFFCQNCGHEESKWLGQCPACGEWNSFVEEKIDSGITNLLKRK